jgi:hypothetical protein
MLASIRTCSVFRKLRPLPRTLILVFKPPARVLAFLSGYLGKALEKVKKSVTL